MKLGARWYMLPRYMLPRNYLSVILTYVNQKDRQYTYLAERMELFRQKIITIFDLHLQFKMILDNLSRKDRMMKRDASNFFKAVFGIPSSNDYKNLVNNLNLLKNSHNSLVNDTRKLAGSLNLMHMVLKKHQGELDKLRMSLLGFQTWLFVINDALTSLLEKNGITYVLLHVDYLLDRLAECEMVLCSQITRLHDVFGVMIQGIITPTLVNPEDIISSSGWDNQENTRKFATKLWKQF